MTKKCGLFIVFIFINTGICVSQGTLVKVAILFLPLTLPQDYIFLKWTVVIAGMTG